jgi:hypothetical protein
MFPRGITAAARNARFADSGNEQWRTVHGAVANKATDGRAGRHWLTPMTHSVWLQPPLAPLLPPVVTACASAIRKRLTMASRIARWEPVMTHNKIPLSLVTFVTLASISPCGVSAVDAVHDLVAVQRMAGGMGARRPARADEVVGMLPAPAAGSATGGSPASGTAR